MKSERRSARPVPTCVVLGLCTSSHVLLDSSCFGDYLVVEFEESLGAQKSFTIVGQCYGFNPKMTTEALILMAMKNQTWFPCVPVLCVSPYWRLWSCPILVGHLWERHILNA